jgi:hypothetical protein
VGRPLKRPGSQKTCPDTTEPFFLPRGVVAGAQFYSRMKNGIPKSELSGLGIFFEKRLKEKEKLDEKGVVWR